jgi:single-strand selective monofunctional uracil DNA glycosylase
VYNPLVYARSPWEKYLSRFAGDAKRVLFVGMNPGPWGMVQTGVPFGEVPSVRDWMGIRAAVKPTEGGHPRLPVLGFDCARSEVSGRRLWGLMRGRFGTADRFFRDQFVSNYCPLLFLDEGGRNITPDKLSAADREPLFRLCDGFLTATVEALRPEWLIGVGTFAAARVRLLTDRQAWTGVRTGGIPHPSPASPRANRDWAGETARLLVRLGVW